MSKLSEGFINKLSDRKKNQTTNQYYMNYVKAVSAKCTKIAANRDAATYNKCFASEMKVLLNKAKFMKSDCRSIPDTKKVAICNDYMDRMITRINKEIARRNKMANEGN